MDSAARSALRNDLGIEAGSGSQNQCFPHGGDMAAAMIWLATLVALPAPAVPVSDTLCRAADRE
jgi:hypothetical protein